MPDQMMPMIGESLNFKFYFLPQFTASFEQFLNFNNAAEGQHEQIISIVYSSDQDKIFGHAQSVIKKIQMKYTLFALLRYSMCFLHLLSVLKNSQVLT